MALTLVEYAGYDALGLARLVYAGEVSPAELAATAFAAMDAVNDRLNAVIGRLDPPVFNANADADAPFRGVPFLLKDLGHGWGGVPSDMGSCLAKGYVQAADSTFAARLRASGLMAVGRTNTSEFGVNGITEPALYGPTNNPWNLSRSPGGSSGGAAAAVAAGIVPIAHASDGGGSIRVPAAWCGLVGLKPSRGRNPLGPAGNEGNSWIITKHVVSRSLRDTAALLDVTSGPGPGEYVPLAKPAEAFLDQVNAAPGRLRIAWSSRLKGSAKPDRACIDAVEQAAQLCAELGHDVEEVTPQISYPEMVEVCFALYIAQTRPGIEAIAAVTGRTPGPDNLEPQTWRTLQRGREMTATDLMQALAQMAAMSTVMAAFMAKYDVFLTPTVSRIPSLTGAIGPEVYADDELTFWDKEMDRYMFCPLPSLTGQPALSLPLHWSGDNLPIGVQLTGAIGDEARLFQLGGQLKRVRPWHKRRPPVHVTGGDCVRSSR